MLQYNHYIELLCLFTGLFLLRNTWEVPYKVLVLLLLLTCVVEITAVLLWVKFRLYNQWLYNIFSPVECLLVLYFFKAIILNGTLKRVAAFLIPVMIFATIVTYFWNKSFTSYNNYAATCYLILWIIACGIFFIDVMINSNSMRLISQPGFWVAIGILFFSVIFILETSLFKVLENVATYKTLVVYFNIITNTFMYGGIIVAFICQYRIKKYSLLS